VSRFGRRCEDRQPVNSGLLRERCKCAILVTIWWVVILGKIITKMFLCAPQSAPYRERTPYMVVDSSLRSTS
jgi:hypothetical protein